MLKPWEWCQHVPDVQNWQMWNFNTPWSLFTVSSEKNNESSKISSTQETFAALEQENDEVELEIVIVATTEDGIISIWNWTQCYT